MRLQCYTFPNQTLLYQEPIYDLSVIKLPSYLYSMPSDHDRIYVLLGTVYICIYSRKERDNNILL